MGEGILSTTATADDAIHSMLMRLVANKTVPLVAKLAVVLTWACMIWRTQDTLQKLEEELPPLAPSLERSFYKQTTGSGKQFGSFQKKRRQRLMPRVTNESEKKIPKDSNRKDIESVKEGGLRFLVFQGNIQGQGAGNHMNGLLAAHLLGDEFNRIVCVSPVFRDFLQAFEPIHPAAVKHCPRVFEELERYLDEKYPARRERERDRIAKGRQPEQWRPPRENLIEMINFNGPPNECDVQAKLASNTSVWYLRANHYPQWPSSSIPENYFEKYYRPTKDLLKLLPNPPPKIVVHLRKEDGPRDRRKGLDEDSFKALGEYLKQYQSPPPYLVTNHVEWYDYFARYNWDHPTWEKVVHSAYLTAFHSASNTMTHKLPRQARMAKQSNVDKNKEQILQLWSDWYTCLTATTVYHTFSDFSASAIRWKDSLSESSRVIRGYNATTQQLELVPEWWRRGQGKSTVLPLVDRPISDLLNCNYTK
jgi:hypothetical protein